MPTTRRRRWALRAVLVAGAVAAGWLLWLLYRSPDRTDQATYWALVVAVLALFLTCVPLLRGSPSDPGPDGDDDAHEQLATAVAAQWERAVAERGLRHPEAVAVRWSLDGALAAPLARALGSSAFAVLPDHEPVDERMLARGGDVHDLPRLLGGLPSGRLVVAGPPGSGKSAAAAMLVVNSLRHRQGLPVPDRRATPVPVLFAVAGWDPENEPVQDWAVGQLRQTYDRLFVGRRGARTAQRLLEGGRITVVLDGIDEMSDGLRARAIGELNRASTCRIVVTGRQDELKAALHQQVLYGAVAVGLQPVGARTASAYLADTRRVDPSSRWNDLVDRMQRSPEGPLARALDTPLMITLVRDGLTDAADVIGFLALCDATPDPDPRILEGYLLDRLVETAYRPRAGEPAPYDVDTARRTLGWVATRMTADGIRQVAWWHIPAWVSRLSRAVAVALVTPLAMFGPDITGLARNTPEFAARLAVTSAFGALVGGWCALGLESAAPLRRNTALERPGLALGYGVALGCLSLPGLAVTVPFTVTVVVATACLVVGVAVTAVPLWSGPQPRRPARLSPVTTFLFGFAGGLAAMNTFFDRLGTTGFLLLFLAISLAGIALALRLGLTGGTGPDVATPVAPLASYRRGQTTEPAGWCLLAVPCGTLTVVGSVLLTTFLPFAGLVAAFGLAVLSGAVLGLIFPEAWLAASASVQLALRHRLPVRLMRFLDDARKRGVLRAVGPAYEFRHGRLQDRLVETAAARRPRYRRATEKQALDVLRQHACTPDDGPCRFAWWHIPRWTSAAPRVAAVGFVVAVIAWLGLGLLAPPLWASGVGTLLAVVAGAGAVLGTSLLERKLTSPAATPRDWTSLFRRPVALGVVLGLTFAIDLNAVPSVAVIFLPIGVLTGAALWLLVGLVLVSGRWGTARKRWRRLTDNVPWLLRLVVGVNVGYVALIVILAFAKPVEGGLYLVIAVATVGAGLRVGLSPAVLCGSADAETDAVTSWGRDRAGQLAVWIVWGAVAMGFAVRGWTGAIATLGLVGISSGSMVTVVVGPALMLVWGAVLGLTFPATWLTSLACVQLRARHGIPLRLMRLLHDARDRGTVRTVGPEFELPDTARTTS